jgi:hypothetical protein
MTKTISGMLWAKSSHPNPRILMIADKIRWAKEEVRVHKFYSGKGDPRYWTKIGPNELGHWRKE